MNTIGVIYEHLAHLKQPGFTNDMGLGTNGYIVKYALWQLECLQYIVYISANIKHVELIL